MFRLKFTMEAGILMRGALRREIEKYCFMRNFDLDLKESKGWFESAFLVTIKGPAKFGAQVKKDMEQWGRQLEEAV